MVTRVNGQLWAGKRARRERGEGFFSPGTVNGKQKFRAIRTLYMDGQGQAVQVSGTASNPEEPIGQRGEKYTMRFVKQGARTVFAISPKPSELKLTLAETLGNWLDWRKGRQTDLFREMSGRSTKDSPDRATFSILRTDSFDSYSEMRFRGPSERLYSSAERQEK